MLTQFEFNTAPNLAILKPKFATLSETALPKYLKGFIWSISYSDGHVTTHKMLDFVNKRAGVDVLYKPTFGMMLTTISVFLAVCAIGVLAYTKLKFFWMRWQVWFAGVLVTSGLFRSFTSPASPELCMMYSRESHS
jgi:hypothetical protein